MKELTNQLSVFTSQPSSAAGDSSQLMLELASLKSQLEESDQETDRLRSDVSVMSQSLIQAQTETATVKSQIIDLQDTIDRLQHEKEELSLIQSSSVTGDEAYNEIVKLNTALNTEITSLKQFIQSQFVRTN